MVEAPKTHKYDVELTYYISSNDKSSVSTIRKSVEEAVSVYNAWQTEKIGRYIDPDELNMKIRDAGAKRVVIASPTFTALDKNSIATLGTVKVTYGGLENG